MKRSRLLGVVAVAVAGLAPSIAAGASGSPVARRADPVVFRIGNTQDVDSLNVNKGVLVVDYEVWNLTLPTLTTRTADFKIAPFLAKSWTSSADGLTWTYTLNSGMSWSDGQPLTAEDVAYTINRSKAEPDQWTFYSSTTNNLTATADSPTQLTITTSVPDPRLPGLEAYILPKHIYEKVAQAQIPDYAADDNVSGGPFMIAEKKEGESIRLVRNPHWWGAATAIDEVVLQLYGSKEGAYNALTAGEVDFINDVPAKIYAKLPADSPFQRVGGNQGRFAELAFNNGCPTGIGDGNPALKDIKVRQAINDAIDRDALVNKLLSGFGTATDTIVPSADPSWSVTTPDAERFTYDPDKAKALLDEAGWKDTNGNGVRDKDGAALKLRLFDRTGGDVVPSAEFVVAWLADVGIATEVSSYDDDTLTSIIGKGEYDMFLWGWVPFLDPDPQLSYFTTAQVTTSADAPGYNDANWCNPAYDALYDKQHVELDVAKRHELVAQMVKLFHDDAAYAVLYQADELMLICAAAWTGIDEGRQPAGTGPLLFNNTAPAYFTLKPTGKHCGG